MWFSERRPWWHLLVVSGFLLVGYAGLSRPLLLVVAAAGWYSYRQWADRTRMRLAVTDDKVVVFNQRDRHTSMNLEELEVELEGDVLILYDGTAKVYFAPRDPWLTYRHIMLAKGRRPAQLHLFRDGEEAVG